jgi:hypothetical protein
MSSRGRKQYDAAFKTKVTLEAVKGEKTIAQLAGENGVHPDQIGRWKSDLLEKLPGLFTSPEFTGFLESQGIRVSMDGRGRVFDNITWTGRRSPFLGQMAKPFFGRIAKMAFREGKSYNVINGGHEQHLIQALRVSRLWGPQTPDALRGVVVDRQLRPVFRASPTPAFLMNSSDIDPTTWDVQFSRLNFPGRLQSQDMTDKARYPA